MGKRRNQICENTLEREMWPGANEKRWEDDPIARRLVSEIGPMNRKQIGAALGISREMVRLIEMTACAKIGISSDELRKLAEQLEEEIGK